MSVHSPRLSIGQRLFPVMAWLVALGVLGHGASAQNTYTYNLYGVPGLIDMPTAQSAEDAELAFTTSHFAGTTRNTLSFQIFPRLSGSFRYSKIDNFSGPGADIFDRSFDLRYQLFDETDRRPAIAVGLQDFVGTGLYSSEYVVATKTFGNRLTVTGGLGWGRLGSYNGFTNPLGIIDERFETRPTGFSGTGGQVESARWFRGDAAFFGGIAYQATENLTLKMEYSSDIYERETGLSDLFERRSPLNFSLNYSFRNNLHMQAYYLYGDTVGVSFNLLTNPRRPAINGGAGPAPTPVLRRAPGAANDLGWTTAPNVETQARQRTASLLAADGITLEAMRISPQSVTIHIRNARYLARAEALGRTARILTRTLPASIETFTIVPVVNGVPQSAITLNRTDIETLEFDPDGAWLSYARAKISDAADSLDGTTYNPALYPAFTWSVGPYLSASYFDPDEPVRLDTGVQLRARYDVAPGWVLSGTLQQRVAGNQGDSTRPSNSQIEKVRSEGFLYAREDDITLQDLTLAHYFRPGKDLYGRVTAGYLEREYGGISAEVLWKPVTSRLALGAEVNYVKQRDFDQLFGFREYDVVTGHASAYYDLGNGYHTQVDAGRYLAGDWGATFTLDRTFANGWSIGAYATFTDVSFDDFGEGSFDKGLRFTVPLDHLLGRPTGQKYQTVIQPLTRDGGARLRVSNRLYETVRSYHDPELKDSWGRFWR